MISKFDEKINQSNLEDVTPLSVPLTYILSFQAMNKRSVFNKV